MDHGRYLSWVSPASEALTVMNFGSQGAILFNSFHADRMNLISICDEVLNKHFGDQTMALDPLKDLQKQVQDLIREVIRGTSLNDTLREYILKHLQIIEAALAGR